MGDFADVIHASSDARLVTLTRRAKVHVVVASTIFLALFVAGIWTDPWLIIAGAFPLSWAMLFTFAVWDIGEEQDRRARVRSNLHRGHLHLSDPSQN